MRSADPDSLPGSAGPRLANAWSAMLALTLALAGCSAGPVDPAPSPPMVRIPGTGPDACFEARQVQAFRVLDQSNLVIYAPNSTNAYYLRVSPPSPDLRNVESLAFVPQAGRICGYAGERLVPGGANRDRYYTILSVTRLSPDAEKALGRSGPGEGVAPPTPEGGPGAQVERNLDSGNP